MLIRSGAHPGRAKLTEAELAAFRLEQSRKAKACTSCFPILILLVPMSHFGTVLHNLSSEESIIYYKNRTANRKPENHPFHHFKYGLISIPDRCLHEQELQITKISRSLRSVFNSTRFQREIFALPPKS